MPLTHVRTFRVRYYECDAYGHVNHANYLRYMVEAAFDASAAAGYDLARYEAMGCLWLVRETEIEYLRPLCYGDVVEVETWVDDFRRVRSRRAYDLRLAGSGEPVARASTDWAFVDRVTARPAPIPDEMKHAFFPEGAPAGGAPRARFPDPGPPPPGAFRHRRPVEWRDLDTAGHVNNAVYLSYVEESGVQWMLTRGRGLAPVVARRHRIAYRAPAVLGDALEIVTWITGVGRTSAVRHTQVRRSADDAVLARIETVQVWIDPETGEAAPVPAEIADAAGNAGIASERTAWVSGESDPP